MTVPAAVGMATDDRSALPPAVLVVAAVFGANVAGVSLAFWLIDSTGLSAVFFVPAGVTLAALVLQPERRWPAVLAAAAGAEILVDTGFGLGVTEALGFTAANSAESLVGALLLRRWVRADLDLSIAHHVWRYLGTAVAGAPLLGALIGSAVAVGFGDNAFAETFFQWWLGDAVGVIVCATLILSWTIDDGFSTGALPLRLLLIGGTAAGVLLLLMLTDRPLLFIVLSGIVVGGAQFGVRTVALTAAAVASVMTLWLPLEQGVLFTGLPMGTGLIIMKLELLVFSATGLVVAAEVAGRVRVSLVALVQSRRLVDEHQVVERLQRLLLPATHLSGSCFTAVGHYSAGNPELGIGGDWYDIEELSDGRIFLSVGDIVGGGAEAAAAMTLLRADTSVLAADCPTARQMIQELDRRAGRRARAFAATTWMGLYDPNCRRLSFAAAGHPPAFLVDSGDVIRLDAQPNPPLAVDPDGPKFDSEVAVPPNARLVLYTDGLIERRNEPIDVGLRRLESALASLTGTEIDPERLQRMLKPPGEPATDDTIVLVVEFGGTVG